MSPMLRDLPSSTDLELRYPSDDLDEGEDDGPEEFGAPPGSYKVLSAQTTEEARFEAARLWEARHPVDCNRLCCPMRRLGVRRYLPGQQRGVVKLTWGVASIPRLSPKQLLGSAAWRCVRLL